MSADVVEYLQAMVVFLGDDDVTGLCVDERRVADESAAETGSSPLIKQQSSAAGSCDGVVRIAVEYCQLALRRLYRLPVSHLLLLLSNLSEFMNESVNQ